MKRVKAACILQTLIFMQKDGLGLSRDRILAMNKDEVEKYKQSLERTNTKHVIVDELEQDDGSIVVHVKKQYSTTADVGEYF